MKIKKFTPENSPAAIRKGSVQVSFNRSGLITISPAAVSLLNLTEKDKVSILQDEDEPMDWFLTKDSEGFEIRPNSGKGLQFNNAGLAHLVLDTTQGKNARIVTFSMSKEINVEAGGYWLNAARPLKAIPIKKN